MENVIVKLAWRKREKEEVEVKKYSVEGAM